MARAPRSRAMGPDFALQEGIRFCICGEQVILLDLQAERYSALPQSCNDDFRRWLTGENLGPSGLRALDGLVQKGIVCAAPSRSDDRAPSPPMPTSRINTSLVQPSLRSVGEAITARLTWAWRAKHWKLKRQTEHIAQLPRPDSTSTARDHRPIARAFEVADLVLGSHDICLERSFAMLSVYRRYGLGAQAIIGVQTAPFAAHCWVQNGETALNEEPDRAQLFTPILVI